MNKTEKENKRIAMLEEMNQNVKVILELLKEKYPKEFSKITKEKEDK